MKIKYLVCKGIFIIPLLLKLRKSKKPHFEAQLKGVSLCSWGLGDYPQQAKMEISRKAEFFILTLLYIQEHCLLKNVKS